MAPVVLDSFHVPLVHDGDNLLARAIAEDRFEEVFIFPIDQDLLLMWADLFEVLDEPCTSVLIKRLSESLSSQHVQCSVHVCKFTVPLGVLHGGVEVPEQG
jgi:hypothetical protein